MQLFSKIQTAKIQLFSNLSDCIMQLFSDRAVLHLKPLFFSPQTSHALILLLPEIVRYLQQETGVVETPLDVKLLWKALRHPA